MNKNPKKVFMQITGRYIFFNKECRFKHNSTKLHRLTPHPNLPPRMGKGLKSPFAGGSARGRDLIRL